MRTFVFISDIPDSLLQPLDDANANASGRGRAKAHRNPAYERLRRLLVAHTSGVMLVMHLGNRGYGLALYASEEEAIAACQTKIYPDGFDPEEEEERDSGPSRRRRRHQEEQGELGGGKSYHQGAPLRLRILQKEKPLPPEAVYQPTMNIEGEVVQKSALATTRGLELAYRGRAIPKWCPDTKRGKDCVFGVACHKVHLAAVQTTVRKRPRALLDDINDDENEDRDEDNDYVRGIEREGDDGDHLATTTTRTPAAHRAGSAAMRALLARSRADTDVYNALVPPSLRLSQVAVASHRDPTTTTSITSVSLPPPLSPSAVCSVITIPLSNEELQAWLLDSSAEGGASGSSHDSAEIQNSHLVVERLMARVAAALEKAAPSIFAEGNAQNEGEEGAGPLSRRFRVPMFVKLSCPGGSPWDWALDDDKVGLPILRECCPLPENGAPTPLERDVLSQKLWFWLNQLNAFSRPDLGLRAVATSQRVRQAVQRVLRSHRGGGTPAVSASSSSSAPPPPPPHSEPPVTSPHATTAASSDELRRATATRVRPYVPGEGLRVGRASAEPPQQPPQPQKSCLTGPTVSLVFSPWLYLPAVSTECTAFLQDIHTNGAGGAGSTTSTSATTTSVASTRRSRAIAIAQRRGELRVMTSASLLSEREAPPAPPPPPSGSPLEAVSAPGEVLVGKAIHALDRLLSRVAVPHRGADSEAEELLEDELQRYSRAVDFAAETMRRHLQTLLATSTSAANDEEKDNNNVSGDSSRSPGENAGQTRRPLLLPCATAALAVHFAFCLPDAKPLFPFLVERGVAAVARVSKTASSSSAAAASTTPFSWFEIDNNSSQRLVAFSSPTTTNSTSGSEPFGRLFAAALAGPALRAVPLVLLLEDYNTAMRRCALSGRLLEQADHHSTMGQETSLSLSYGAADRDSVELVEWNVRRHAYEPLFSREVLQRLKKE